MATWYLIMWSYAVSPFLAGEYHSLDRCEASAQMQAIGLRGAYGPGKLHWRCQQKNPAPPV